MDLITCKECGEQHRDDLWICPFCGCAVSFPNVNEAERQREQDALQQRYNEAVDDASDRGVTHVLQAFERAVGSSEAVICRYFGELTRLAYSDEEIYATYYQRIAAGVRLPGGDKWARLRAIDDTILFGPLNMIQIRFAALSLDGHGSYYYGDCSLCLKESVIAHRTSVFEENSVMFMQRHKVRADKDYEVPHGYRAPWTARHLLAVAKLGGELTAHTTADEFPAVLASSSSDPIFDRFIEVHVWGALNVRSLSRVRSRKWVTLPSELQLKEIDEKLAQFQVVFEKP